VALVAGLELTIPVDFELGVSNKSGDYLAKFPLGKIPALETKSGLLLVESQAIAFHIANSAPAKKRAQLLGETSEELAEVLQWIWFTEQQLIPTLRSLNLWRYGLVEYDVEEELVSEGKIKRWLKYFESALESKDWFAGNGTRPSLADIVAGGTIFTGVQTYLDKQIRSEYPKVFTWFENLKNDKVIGELFVGDMIEERKRAIETDAY
jgi:elongation factor 1-gamma